MKHYATKRETVIEALERAFTNGCAVRADCKASASDIVTERDVPTMDEALRIIRIGYTHVTWIVRTPDGAEVPL